MSTTTAWFYLRNGQQIGPIGTDELRAALRSGSVQPGDLVWRQGLPAWAPAGDILEFFPTGNPGYNVPLAGLSPGFIPYATQPLGFVSYAGFWKRFLALIIDWLVTLIPSFFIGVAIGFSVGPGGRDAQLGSNLVGTVIWWLYFALMESSKFQGTLGKLALGIKVTDMNGQPITFGRASGRHFAKILSGLILCIGFLMAAFTEKKQALHDTIASCLVLNRA